MKMNEYLSQVTDQIRCQKVHKAVRAELQAHLEDQAEAYESEGMSADEAMEKAVLEMGDPVETGVSLDRGPQTSYGVERTPLSGCDWYFQCDPLYVRTI